MISIVIPVHNKEVYIENTLQCVLNQTYKNFELVLVNDGSQDASGAICDRYASQDPRIKVIHQKNGGVSNARNTGIKATKNELIAFIDADDYWSEEFLQSIIGLMNKFPDVDIYSSKYATIQKGKIMNGEEYFPPGQEFILFDLIERCAEKARFPINSSSVVIRKSAIEKVGYFDERITCFEDFDLLVRLALHSKVAYLNQEPLSFYNLDVPAESKARGAVPDLKKHWISYMDKFNEVAENNEKLQLLLDRSILSQLFKYRRLPEYKQQVRNILKRVRKKNFPLKFKLVYYTPTFMGNFIIKSYNFIRTI